MGKLIKYAAALVAVGLLGIATSARATIIIDYPMSYTTPNVVGTVSGGAQGNAGYGLAQTLINLAKNTTWTDPNTQYTYVTHVNDDYSGPLPPEGPKYDVKLDKPETPEDESNAYGKETLINGYRYIKIDGGAQYIIAKYDGPNAGWVMFYLGGQEAYIPVLCRNFWPEQGTNDYEISNYTVIPEPTSVIAGALLLLPFAASTVRYVRRNRKA